MKANNLVTTWQAFFNNLKHRFDVSMYEDHQGNLSKLSQTSSVVDFQSSFKDLVNKVGRELLFSRPSSLMEAFALARAFEAQSKDAKQGMRVLSKWNLSSTSPTSHYFTNKPTIQPSSF